MRPQLEGAGVKLLFVTCGNTQFVQEWLDGTKWPAEATFLDQQGLMYKKLGAKSGVWRTFLSPKMWIWGTYQRFRQGGLWKAFMQAVRSWKLSVPEAKWQSYQQGGTFVARGKQVVWTHIDNNPGDYPDWNEVVQAALKAAGKPTGKA